MKETETIEFKKTTAELKEAVISISSMLNKQGFGTVYFGIEDSGKVVGQSIGFNTLNRVTQTIVDNIEPKIYPKVEVIEIDGKSCIQVIANGINSPYFAYNRAYIRVGESDKSLSVQEIKNRILNNKRLFWETEPSKKSIGDVDEKTLIDFMSRAKSAQRIDFDFDNVKTTLNKLHLLKGDYLTNAAEILFCNDNFMEIQAGTFAGTDKLTFLDFKLFKGDLFRLRQQAETYIFTTMRWRADLSGSRRIEIPEIPVRALSEAVGNSLVHRDFENSKGNEIAIYTDRIEIYNPGQFPEGIEPMDYYAGNEHSVLRNPHISEIIFRSKDIERWGSGIKRIHDECNRSNIRVEFKRLKTGFVVCFYRPERESDIPRVVEKVVERVVEKVVENISQNQKEIIQCMSSNPLISALAIARSLGISQRKVQTNIKRLKELGLISRIGPDKGGQWVVHKQRGT